jgi:hypothetical protein
MAIVKAFNEPVSHRMCYGQVTVKCLEVESRTGQCVLYMVDDTINKMKGLPSLNRLNVLGHVVRHEFMQFVGHPLVSFIGWYSIDWPLEVTRLINVSQAFFTRKGKTSFEFGGFVLRHVTQVMLFLNAYFYKIGYDL